MKKRIVFKLKVNALKSNFSRMKFFFTEYLHGNVKLILTNYDQRRCLDDKKHDAYSIASSLSNQLRTNETLFKIRTQG